MGASQLNPQQEAELMARLRADPGFQRVANAQYPTPMLRSSRINDYLFNDPRSPLYDVNHSVGDTARGGGAYGYDTDTNNLKYQTIGPQHWWSDPGIMGPIITAAAAGGLGFGALAGGGGAPATAGATGAAEGILPSSQIPGWAEAAMGGPAAIASQGASRGIPWGGAANAAEDYLGSRPRSGVGRALGAAGDEASRWSPLLQSAISALAGLPALLTNHGPSAEERALYDQARQMQALQQKRIEHQNPLFSAVTQLAMSRLPGASQQPLGNL